MKNNKKEIFESQDLEKCLDKIKDWSTKRKAVEICGFLGFKNDKYILWHCQNIAEDPTKYFAIDPLDFLVFKEENKILCVFHSHIFGNENPSEFDVTMSENCCVPFMIYSLNTKKFKLFKPKTNEADSFILSKVEKAI